MRQKKRVEGVNVVNVQSKDQREKDDHTDTTPLVEGETPDTEVQPVQTTTGKELLQGLAERAVARKKLYVEIQEHYW